MSVTSFFEIQKLTVKQAQENDGPFLRTKKEDPKDIIHKQNRIQNVDTIMTMKAMQLTYKVGQAKIIDVEKPTVLPSDALVHVMYSALDPCLKAVVEKELSALFVHARTDPLILGWRYVGKVVEVGADVKDLAVDDQVWGFLQYEPSQKQGAFAEYITVNPADCALHPKNVSLDILAAASTEGLTALQAMRNYGGLEEGKSVLILGAGGGVGAAAVQIAKNLGAHVTAVCSTKDMDVVIDRTSDDPLGSKTATYDVIFDTPGQYSATDFIRKLKPKGSSVATKPSLSMAMGMILSLFNGKGSKFVQAKSNRADLELVGSWLSEGKLSIEIDSTHDVKDLELAISRNNERAKVGRVVIKVEGGW
jgi:NADPH:quinone reductase-like Zn-dependent oxidoreductase